MCRRACAPNSFRWRILNASPKGSPQMKKMNLNPRVKPLALRRIVVTRARAQASGFMKLLRSYGACVLACPAIRIAPPKSFENLDMCLRGLHTYDWLIFTSVNGVEMFARRMNKVLHRRRIPPRIKTCAIGPETAKKMRSCRMPVHRVSKAYVAESVLEALPDVKGKKILIPRASVARNVLPRELRRRGAQVDVAPAYQTVVDQSGLASFRRWLKHSLLDCITFTSSSTVKNLFSVLSRKESSEMVRSPRIFAASIGPITTETLKRYGWAPRIIADQPTTKSLAEAIASCTKFYERR